MNSGEEKEEEEDKEEEENDDDDDDEGRVKDEWITVEGGERGCTVSFCSALNERLLSGKGGLNIFVESEKEEE